MEKVFVCDKNTDIALLFSGLIFESEGQNLGGRLMKRIFISHPLAGNEAANREDAAGIVQRLSAADEDLLFINPLDLFQSLSTSTPEYIILARCMAEIESCDWVVQCPGWEASRGCVAEAAFAKLRKIKLVSLLEFIKMYQGPDREMVLESWGL
jgi:hypothetical protein